MFKIPNWPERPIWSEEILSTLLKGVKDEPKYVTLEEIKTKSDAFPVKFPIDSVRCKSLVNMVSKEALERYINSAYPVVHEKVLQLFLNFLFHKSKFGNESEKRMYKEMTVLELVERLLSKRAVVFLNKHDKYMLLDGTRSYGGWEQIGTEFENENLNLKKCLSYDEIKLSALLSVTSFTTFINDGNWYNRGVVNRSHVAEEGIIVGLIGTRFQKPEVMEYADTIISKNENDKIKDTVPTMRNLISEFYEEAPLVYEEVTELQKTKSDRFVQVNKNDFFDNNIYCKRIILSIETLLFEAQQRASEQSTSAFVHVVGIGLGVWKISPHQNSLFLNTFVKRLEILGQYLHAVSDIVFAHFGEHATVGDYINGTLVPVKGHPNNGIKVYLSHREPHNKLCGEHERKLLVISYAWDGNALPGNEFWIGCLGGSGDSVAACSTQVTELHNAHINTKVCAQNLRVAGPFGVIPYSRYREVAVLVE